MNLEIASRLQKLRKEKGFSQEELAEKLGISRQAVSKWERAESSPDTDNLICLARLYGISIDELLNVDEETNIQSEDEEDEDLKDEFDKTSIIHGISVLTIIVTYFILGVTLSLWHPAWILFLFIPINSSLIDAIKYKNPQNFAYPIFTVAIYLFCGIVFSLWHPMWLIFITIPLYYLVCDLFRKKK